MSDKTETVTSKGAIELDEDRLDTISGGPTAVENILATGPGAFSFKMNALKIEVGAFKGL